MSGTEEPVMTKQERENLRQERIRRATKMTDELKNPCIKEQKMSMRCIHEHFDNKEVCGPYFQNYNNCKNFWDRVKIDRKRKGLSDPLPPPEEREKVKAEYMKKMRDPLSL